MAIERVELIKKVPAILERVMLEDGSRILVEPKKADTIRRNIAHRKAVRRKDRGRAISMELQQEGLGPRGFGSSLAGWQS